MEKELIATYHLCKIDKFAYSLPNNICPKCGIKKAKNLIWEANVRDKTETMFVCVCQECNDILMKQ